MNKFFTADDFEVLTWNRGAATSAAQMANAKLEAALGPPITGYLNTFGQWGFGAEPKHKDDTHTCRPFNIQPLPPKECEQHVPTLVSKNAISQGYAIDFIQGWGIKCINCGKALKAKWEES